MGSRPATTDPLLSGSVRSGSRLAERRTAQRLQRSLRTACACRPSSSMISITLLFSRGSPNADPLLLYGRVQVHT